MTQNYLSMRKMNRTILRYFLVIFLFSGSILAGTIGTLYNLESKDYLKRIELEEQVNLKLQLKLISNNLEGITSDLLFLSKQNELQHLINKNEQSYQPWISQEYFELCSKKGVYDQIRYLDETGMEIARVNFNNGNPEIIEKSALQNKGNRYYFKETFSLGKNGIFVSPLDLNIENGEIETPLKPMIRFGVPVFDDNNQKRGVIILNYLGGKLIDSLKKAAGLSMGDIMLVNTDGYWLYSPVKGDEWGFMIKERIDRKFFNTFPEAWREITSSDNCQIYTEEGLFTSTTIYPLREGLTADPDVSETSKGIAPEEYYWKIISHIPTEDLRSGTRNLLVRLFLMATMLFLLASIPSWMISKTIVRRKLLQMKLYRSANYDKLTDLPNRSLFQDRLTQALIQAKRYNLKFALMFIDLDGFKNINDTLGHVAGDELLIKAAKRLSGDIRDSDTVARMGGDEFTVILHSISDVNDSEIVAQKLIQGLSVPFNLKAGKAQISASIGISIYPESGDNSETLLKKSDKAMYQAKKHGKNDYRISS